MNIQEKVISDLKKQLNRKNEELEKILEEYDDKVSENKS